MNLSTTTSSAILTQENFTFVPYSDNICRHFLSISATIVEAFETCFKTLRRVFFDVHNSRRPVVSLPHARKSYRVTGPMVHL